MSRPINITDSLSFSPTGYTGATNIANENTAYPWSRGYNNSSYTTNCARFQLSSSDTSTVCYIYYTFSISGIPTGATISSVSCSARISRNSRVGSSTIQLYNGTTAKGAATTFSSTSTTGTYVTPTSISNTGSWNVSELSNLRLRISGVRSNTNNTGYIYFWGATVTVTYTISGTEYDITSTLSTDKIDEIDPAGVTAVMGGNSYELRIDGASIDDISVEDNGVDVTSSLVRHNNVSGAQTFTGIPTSFDDTNSVYDTSEGDNGVYNNNYISNGLTNHTSTTRAAIYATKGSNADTYIYYNFDCSSIPSSATITSVSCQVKAGNQGTNYYSSNYRQVQLCAGTTTKGSSQNITGSNSSPTTVTVDGGSSWTREELNNIKLRYWVRRGTSNTSEGSTLSFYGATLTVTYTIPAENSYYWTYSLTNVNADHTIIIGDAFIEIPEEDPQYTYYPITISSINAITDPGRGTTRVVAGTNETITITPSESQVTLILDNGTDVSSQLVSHNNGTPSYTVATASGASYGFTLNSSTGYYVSQNAGQSNSAAVARVSLSLPVRCLITFSYINYAEATYDYGIFGNIDSALGTTYTADSNVKLACSTNDQNTSSVQTLTYEIEAGSHFIDVKFIKDTNTNSNNDNLQFKLEITELEANNYYTYTLSNINQAHSLIFVFGNVSYYFVNTSSNGPKLYPNGQFVVLQGDSYKLTIVPEDYNDTITVTDNNTDVTNLLQEVTTEIEKDGQTITAVNYVYRLSNISAAHTIEVVKAGSSDVVYLKVNGSWVSCSKVYKKVNGSWVEQSSFSNLFDSDKIYIKV